MRARSRLLVLTWVGCGALVSAGFIACSSDDSANPAAIDVVDSSIQVPPGPDDTEAEGGGPDSTVADGPEVDSTTADGPTEATGTDGPTEATSADGGMPEAGADAGDGGTDASEAGADADDGGTDAAEGGAEAGPPEAGTDGGLTTLGVIGAIRGDTCRQCAIDHQCDPTMDVPTCEGTTGVSASGSPDPGVARSTLCFSTLTCVLQANCFVNDSVAACYCGTVDVSSCSTSDANGPCKTQEEDGYETTDVNVILNDITLTDTGSDAANQIVECLYFDCPTECSFPDAGP